MTEKLKPCAYCQSPLELEWMSYAPYKEGGRWFVECSNLECPTYFNGEDKDEVISAWNARPSCKDCVAECPITYRNSFGSEERVNDHVDYCSEFVRKENG